jgi:hypothetical protein
VSTGRQRFAVALLGGTVMAIAAGCGPVAGNYPSAAPAPPARTIDPAIHPAASVGPVTFRIGPAWDRARLLAARKQTYDMMRAGMGDAAFEDMLADLRGANDCTARLDAFDDHTVLRGAIELTSDQPVIIEKGVLVLEMTTGTDTFTVRDDGIFFYRHESRPLECLFTGGGAIRYERRWNDLPAGSENRCNILVPRAGTVIDVNLDPARLRVLDP